MTFLRLLWLLTTSLLLTSCTQLDALCDGPGCQFSTEEWARLESLTDPGPPPDDPANAFVGVAAAEAIGQQLFFDWRLSGLSTHRDSKGRHVGIGHTALGSPARLSCASCHDPAQGGSDGPGLTGVSVGAGLYPVSSMTVINSVYYPVKYWNGRTESLVWQAAHVFEADFSMNSNRVAITRVLSDHYRADYDTIFTEQPLPAFVRTASEAAGFLLDDGACPSTGPGVCPVGCAIDSGTCWPRWPLAGKPGATAGCDRSDPNEPFGDAYDCMDEADRDVVDRAYVNAAKAIAAYEHRLVQTESAFDKFVREGPDSDLISPAAQRGARLFVSKASCIDCHSGPHLSDFVFHNIAVPATGPGVFGEEDCPEGDPVCDCVSGSGCQPWGWFDGLSFLQAEREFRSDGPFSDAPDVAREKFYDLPLKASFKGAWRTQGLRNISETAPYMHTGAFPTLESVVRHYNQGGSLDGPVPGQRSRRIRPLGLTEEEIWDLVAFLHTLDGEPLPASLVTSPAIPGLVTP